MASSSSQEGSGLTTEETFQDVYNILDVNTIRDSDNHDWIAVTPSQGQNLTEHNKKNTCYDLKCPKGIFITKDTFYVAECEILYGTTNPVAAYDPAVATTHCTVQNSALSLFNKGELLHGGQSAQVVMEPAKIATILKTMSSYEEGKSESENGFTYLNRGLTYDAATGREFGFPEIAAGTPGTDNSGGAGFALVPLSVRAANAAKGSANDTLGNIVVLKNETTYDESFEKRYKYTGGKSSFFLKSNLNIFGLFGYRDVATFLHNTVIKLWRNDNDAILENRDAGHTIADAPARAAKYVGEVYLFYDRMYTIKGANDLLTPIY